MDALLYTGTGSANTAVTGTGFKPDLVWAKSRSNAQYNGLFDSVRSGYALYSNATDAEDTTEQVTFNTNGFTTPNKSADFINTSGYTYVAWQWQAGQGTTSSNTDGSITSTVSVNASAGFSIVTYTGTGAAATIGHGLGVAPKWIIVKNRDQADAWQVYHAANTAAPETDYLVLNTTAATADAADRWNDTLPTSTVFSIGNGVEVNTNTEKYVAYCWSEVAGYSKFGSYDGNNSSDGPFIYTGFRPKFVIIKNTSGGTQDWLIWDTSRSPHNVSQARLRANTSDAEASGDNFDYLDALSNGFKLRGQSGSNGSNGSGYSYIYMAFAESPFKYANAR
jgi:hypothetical protein